jgi:excinuclease UvrABC nuclease subunit
MKRIIIEENRGKSGIYLITNKQTSDFYIGQAGDISKRYVDYLNLVTLNG